MYGLQLLQVVLVYVRGKFTEKCFPYKSLQSQSELLIRRYISLKLRKFTRISPNTSNTINNYNS